MNFAFISTLNRSERPTWMGFIRHVGDQIGDGLIMIARNAIEDLELRSDNYHLAPVRNPGAMLMAALERCREQIARSLARTHATQKK